MQSKLLVCSSNTYYKHDFLLDLEKTKVRVCIRRRNRFRSLSYSAIKCCQLAIDFIRFRPFGYSNNAINRFELNRDRIARCFVKCGFAEGVRFMEISNCAMSAQKDTRVIYARNERLPTLSNVNSIHHALSVFRKQFRNIVI